MGLDFITSDIVNNVASGTNKYYLLTIGSTFRVHMAFLTYSIPGATLKILEAPTVSANGTALDIIAQNRVNLPTSTISIYKDPTVTDDGTLLYSVQIGSSTTGGRGGILSKTEFDVLEFVFNMSTNYLLKITTLANNTDISTSFTWIESSI